MTLLIDQVLAALAEADALVDKGQFRADTQEDGVGLAAQWQPEGVSGAQKVAQALAQLGDVALPRGMLAEVRAIEDGVQADDCLLYTSRCV